MSQILDPRALEELRKIVSAGNPNLLVELLGDYREAIAERVPLMREAAKTGNFEVIRFQAHTLKSSSASLGMIEVEKQCVYLENLGTEAKKPEVLVSEVQNLEKSIRRALLELEERVAPAPEIQVSAREQKTDTSSLETWGRGLSGFTTLAGIVVLIGWVFDIGSLKSIIPGFITMKSNTAACFIASGLALFLYSRRYKYQAIPHFLVVFTCLVAALTLGEYAFDIDFGIDELLFKDNSTPGLLPQGRLAPMTAVNFLFINIAMALAFNPIRRRLFASQILCFFVAMTAWQGFIGYVLGIRSFGSSYHFQMAIHTIFLFLCLSLALFAHLAEAGFVKYLVGPGIGARQARQFLMVILFLLPFVNRVQIWAEALGLVNRDFGSLIRITFNTSILVFLIIRTAVLQRRAEIAKSQSSETLEAQQALFETTMQQMPLAVIIAEAPSGRLVFANKAMETVWRHPLYASKSVSEYAEWKGFHRDGRPYQGTDWPLARALTQGIVVSNEDTIVERGDKTRGIIRLSASPVVNNEGKMIAGVVVCEDRTEIQEAEKQRSEAEVRERLALEAARTKADILATMSHEIRTPLNAIIGLSGLVLEKDLSAEQRDNMETIRKSGDSLLEIINDILDISKIEAGKLRLENIDFDVREVVGDLHKTFYRLFEQKRLSFTLDIERDFNGFIKGDPNRLRQVLNNLIGNALKFTRTGGVTLRLRSQQQRLRFEIIDTGVGISEQDQKKLFSAFTQADATTTRKFGGTGLGLAISKRLVEMMDGQIGIESEVGKGSTFWFEILLITGNEVEKLEPARADSLQKIKAHVLVAEDNPVNQKIVVRQLEKIGISVEVVGNGLEVIERLRTKTFDLILLDCQMPEMDGYECARIVRPLSRMPIIAMTANVMQGDRERCLQAGMHDYIAKPVRVAELHAVLSRWLAHQASQ